MPTSAISLTPTHIQYKNNGKQSKMQLPVAFHQTQREILMGYFVEPKFLVFGK